MIGRKNRLRLPMLLILVGLGLIPIVYPQLRATPKVEIAPTPANTALAELQKIPRQPVYTLPPLESFDAILARPIFNINRRPAAKTENPRIITPAAPLAVTLKGTVVDGSERRAILVDPRKKAIITLQENGQFQGWTLSDVEPAEVTFTRNGVEQRLMLKYGDMPADRGSKRAAQGTTQQE